MPGLSTLCVMLASLFGIAVLNERLAAIQLVGIGLILLTVTTPSLSSRAR